MVRADAGGAPSPPVSTRLEPDIRPRLDARNPSLRTLSHWGRQVARLVFKYQAADGVSSRQRRASRRNARAAGGRPGAHRITTHCRADLESGRRPGTPGGIWFQLAVDEVRRSEGAQAVMRDALPLLAAECVALHDAFIACWRVKLRDWSERPVTAVRRDLDARRFPPPRPPCSATSAPNGAHGSKHWRRKRRRRGCGAASIFCARKRPRAARRERKRRRQEGAGSACAAV
jgi:hypothetical protein